VLAGEQRQLRPQCAGVGDLHAGERGRAVRLGPHRHGGLNRALHIRVDQQHVMASQPPRQRQLQGDRGLADSALRVPNRDKHLASRLIGCML